MGFYRTKPAFRAALRPVARAASIWPADVWTWLTVGLSLVTGGLLGVSRQATWLLLIVPPLLFVRLLLNVLDGVIAQETQTASARGEALSEFADRLSDVAILTGFAVSGWGSLPAAAAATIIVLLVSYVGILGKAVGAGRQYGGLMGKPDRMVVLMVACVVQYAITAGWIASNAAVPRAFDVASGIIGALGVITMVLRMRAIYRALAAKR